MGLKRKCASEEGARKSSRIQTLLKEAEKRKFSTVRVEEEKWKKLSAEVKQAPVFQPTEKEFLEPMLYIQKIRPIAEEFGICKIIPPPSFLQRNQTSKEAVDAAISRFDKRKTFATKRQRLDRLTSGRPYGEGKKYTLESYRKMADAFQLAYATALHSGNQATEGSGEIRQAETDLHKVPQIDVHKEYWKLLSNVETCDRKRGPTVEYGNDIDTESYGSGFDILPDEKDETRIRLRNCGWNLKRFPFLPGSVLASLPRGRGSKISGITTTWLYIGMMFSTFCWHVEDNWLYSINHSHAGATKTWFGVPATHALNVEDCIRRSRKLNIERRRKRAQDAIDFDSDSSSDEDSASSLDDDSDVEDVVRDITLMVSPIDLVAAGIPVCTTDQNPGEFVITFPCAFHGGFSHGFNIGEAVNFALPDWIPYGCAAMKKYCSPASAITPRPSVFDHDRLMFDICNGTLLQDSNLLKLWCNAISDDKSNELNECHYSESLESVSSIKESNRNCPLFALKVLRLELQRIIQDEEKARTNLLNNGYRLVIYPLEDRVGQGQGIRRDDVRIGGMTSLGAKTVFENENVEVDESIDEEPRICLYCKQAIFQTGFIKN
eukprot:g6306.t1